MPNLGISPFLIICWPGHWLVYEIDYFEIAPALNVKFIVDSYNNSQK
jgi:hypothetical protein